MMGIDPEIMVHRLTINEDVRPVKQNKRNFSSEKNFAIKEEVDQLLATYFIELWLSTMVGEHGDGQKS